MKIQFGLLLALAACGTGQGPLVPDARYASTVGDGDAIVGDVDVRGERPISGDDISQDPSNSEDVMGEDGHLPEPINGDTKVPQEPGDQGPPDQPEPPVTVEPPLPPVVVHPGEKQGTWEGWGTNLGAWAHGVGASSYETAYAELLFSNHEISYMNKKVAGLGLNIVRYQAGGGGQAGDSMAMAEAPDRFASSDMTRDGFEAFRDVDGFWKDGTDADPAGSNFDWTRDANQRSFLQAAKARGATVFELNALAPMWWMTDEKSASGGRLNGDAGTQWMHYLSLIAQRGIEQWGIPFTSIAPFNESTQNPLRYPAVRQGGLVPIERQPDLIRSLKSEIEARGLSQRISVAGGDEVNPNLARDTHQKMGDAAMHYSKLNVHTDGNFRDIGARKALKNAAGAQRLWVSQYSDSETSGKLLARSVIDDIRHLKATAWIYGPTLAPYGQEGLITANFHTMPADPNVRGQPTQLFNKYFVLAHFSRSLRPGQEILGSSDENSVVSYDRTLKSLRVVVVNEGDAVQRRIDLSAMKKVGSKTRVYITRFDGSKLLKSVSELSITNKQFSVRLEGRSVTTFEILFSELP